MHGLFKVSGQFDLLPKPIGKCRSFDRLHEQVADAIFLSDRGILRVRQRARCSATKSGQIVLVSAELLSLGLRLVLTERLINDGPNDVVMLHFESLKCPAKLETVLTV